MAVKTAGVGHFTIPTAPAAGTSCTSGAANVFTTTYVQLIASTAAAIYITGIYVEEAAVTAGTYIIVQLATGGAGSETIVGQHLIAPVTGSTVTRAYKPIYPPIPVANATRIACKTADSVGSQAKLITLECINQSNVVDDGIAMSANVTQWLGSAVAAAVAGVPYVDTQLWKGGAVPAVSVTGVPKVDVADWLGSAVNATAVGYPDVNIVGWKNVSPNALISGRVDASVGAQGLANLTANVQQWSGTNVASPITAGVPIVDWTPSPVELTGTATASAASSITLAAAASTTANFYCGMTILITSGTGKGQARLISGYTTGRVATVTPAWTTTPATTATYIILPLGPSEIEGVLFGNRSTGGAVTAASEGLLDINLKNAVNVAATLDANNVLNVSAKYLAGTTLTGRDIGASVLLSTGTGTGQLDFTAGVVKANATQWLGGTIPAVNVTGVPKVDIVDWLGSAPNALQSGRVDSYLGAHAAAQDVSTRRGTAQAGAAGTITLDSGASATDSFYNWQVVAILSGTGIGQSRTITGYTGSSKVAAVAPNWTTNPDSTSVFALIPTGRVDVGAWLETAVTAATAGIPDVNTKNISNVTVSASSAQIGVNVVNWAGGAAPAPNVTGVPLVDAKYILGTIISTPATAGILDVNVKNIVNVAAILDANNLLKVDLEDWKGSVVNALIGGRVDVNIGAQALANLTANVQQWSGTTVAATNTAGVPVVDTRQLIRQGTAQGSGNSATAIKLDASASATDGYYKGMKCIFISGTGSPIAAVITAYVGSTKIATLSPAVPVAPDGTTVFQIFSAMVDIESWAEVVPNALISGRVDANAQVVGDKTGYSLTQTFPANFALTSIDGSGRVDIGKTLGTAVTLDANNVLNVSTKYIGGTLQTARDIGASVLLSTGTGTGQLDFTAGVVKANATQWLGGTIPTVNVTGVPLVDAKYLLGTIFATPATAGVIDTNLKNIANVAVSTSTAQLGVNVVNFGGNAGTFAAGIPAVNSTKIGGTTQTGGDIFPAVSNIPITGEALNAIAGARVLNTGTEANTYTSTQLLDGAYHSITAVGGAIDIEYSGTLPNTSGQITGMFWKGYLAGVGNTANVSFWNYNTSAYEQVEQISGVSGTPTIATESEISAIANNNHTGSGGTWKVKMSGSGMTLGVLNTDLLSIGYAVPLTAAQVGAEVWSGSRTLDALTITNNFTIGGDLQTTNFLATNFQVSTFVQLPDIIVTGDVVAAGNNSISVNTTKISGSATAADQLKAMFAAAANVVVDTATFSATTTVFETEDTVDSIEKYREQSLFGVTGANAGVTVPITGYTFSGNSKVKLTVEALPSAPADGDIFIKVGRIEQ